MTNFYLERVQARNWSSAQSIELSISLVPAVLEQLCFLSRVDSHRCLYGGAALSRAIQRYEECWLPLLAACEHGLTPEGLPLQPPLDCEWIWHCHRLSPTMYAEDCRGQFKCHLIGSHANSTLEAIKSSQKLWKEHFPQEDYTLDLTHFHYDKQWQPCDTEKPSKLKYNLYEAAARQSAFYYQVSRPHMKDWNYLRGAEQRYKAFIYLHKLSDNQLFLVPLYDIDLMWHAHQLNEKAYEQDLMKILNRLLPHDDSVTDRTPGRKLAVSYAKTLALWKESYGFSYVREGAMYRGEAPAAIFPPPAKSGQTMPMSDFDIPFEYSAIKPREVAQVTLTVVKARYIPTRKKSTVRVRFTMAKKSDVFGVETCKRKSSARGEIYWDDYRWRFQAETTTEALCLEMLQRCPNTIKQKLNGSTVLGRMSLSWQTIKSSLTLFHDQWFDLSLSGSISHSAKDLSSVRYRPSLFISLSWTPPRPGPHLFRIIESGPVDHNLSTLLDKPTAESECWWTRTVFDHANREVFVVRARCSKGQSCIHVHQGGWIYINKSMKKKTVYSAKIVATAEEVVTGQQSEEKRSWTFLNNSAQLSISRTTSDTSWSKALVLDLHGSFQNQVYLASGRKLDYEVMGGEEEDEAGFVTVIRYNKFDAPHGKATALFNWKTGLMEVSPEENVVFVLLISNIIALSVLDVMGCSKSSSRLKMEHARQKKKGSSDEWGSIFFTHACKSTSPDYRCWWQSSPLPVASSSFGSWMRAQVAKRATANRNKFIFESKVLTSPIITSINPGGDSSAAGAECEASVAWVGGGGCGGCGG